MIEAKQASLLYAEQSREIYACKAIDMAVTEGEFVGILGPSGSGKSSLLYLLSGLKTPTSGQILVDGLDISSLSDEGRAKLRRRDFSFVFQQPYLLGYLSARENVAIGCDAPDALSRADELLNKLGLGDKGNRFPHELSGGERQRVCVARALVGNPRAIFADEPTAALDHTNGEQVVALLNAHRGSGALVMVTHDPSMLRDADRIVRIADGELVKEA